MNTYSFKFIHQKILIYAADRMCDTPEELLSSPLFREFLGHALNQLRHRRSPLLDIFENPEKINDDQVARLVETLIYLTKVRGEVVPNIVKDSDRFFRNNELLNDFVEYLYNYWRDFDRFVICSSAFSKMEEKPYRTFDDTIEHFTHLMRKTYRDIQENITGHHPAIYRQVRAGAEIAAITSNQFTTTPDGVYQKLRGIPIIRQILLNPPLILNPPMNKRTGRFVPADANPLDRIDIRTEEWFCFPARVGKLVILIYFHEKFAELGFSLCNLFELANNADLERKPDGIYLYGVPGDALDQLAKFPTIFHYDTTNDMLVAAVPNRDEFGYFGYLKKMALTLHNIRMMQRGAMPFHGALVNILLHSGSEATILMIGDTGAGKSETLEAFRIIGDDRIRDMTIIADDMGSLKISGPGRILGYGTEIGAYVRLDDLQAGYAFGQLDRTIIMNPDQVNARAVLPVTTYSRVVRGYPVDMILYANNYETVDEDHPLIEQFRTAEDALRVFREGTVMSKGTTTSTGLVHSYFANVFGPAQYRTEHEVIAGTYFDAFIKGGLFVGQIRTRLGISGSEAQGPEEAARALLGLIDAGNGKN
ncbi:MAG: phosphoenolpyruvate carboxykinase [Deltaproteobacteria bacterium]|nr:phosphoenolpyruvate carboxykinase [Deltaproteobacteria bacterium]